MAEHLLARRGEDLLAELMHPRTRAFAAAQAPLPEYVADFLVRLRLGLGVPFGYLVPDEALLPNESIRFFTVDEAWLDSLMAGAMAVGAASTRDTDHTADALPMVTMAVRDAVPVAAAVRRREAPRADVARHVCGALTSLRAVQAQADDLGLGGTPPTTGFLLRSALVSGWPGFAVRAFTRTDIGEQQDPATVDPADCVPILRMELLSPSVLLVLFSGSPALVWLEEPHHAIQLGVDPGDTVNVVTTAGAEVTSADAHGDQVPETVAVPMRASAPAGVVDIAGLVGNLNAQHASDPRVAPQGGSAALALQLVRPPWRQRFSIDENGQ